MTPRKLHVQQLLAAPQTYAPTFLHQELNNRLRLHVTFVTSMLPSQLRVYMQRCRAADPSKPASSHHAPLP